MGRPRTTSSDWPKEGLRRPDGAPACGAKNRQGKPCMMIPARGQRRCRMHHGLSPTRELQRCMGSATRLPEAQVRIARAEGDIRPDDPRVLDMRETIALMLSLVEAARSLVINEQAAEDFLTSLREAGIDTETDLGQRIRDALRQVQFDRTMAMVNALAKIGGIQTNAIRVQAVAQLLLQQLLPTLSDFAQRFSTSAERFIPADRRAEWREEARRIAQETQEKIIRQTEAAQNVAGR